MGFRFRRRVKLLPGFTLNLSKSGASLSLGDRGAHVTLGKQGVRTTVGLPGTGVSYTELSRPQAPPNPGQRRRHPALLLILAALLILVALLLIAAAPAPALDMPDPATTPGAANPDITQATIDTTICHPGWSTRSIRPPSSYTNALKRQQLADPRYIDKALADYEEDHLIPLEIGGAPRDPRNLWPEAYDGPCGALVKDRLEDKLHTLVCNGTLTLAEAQQAIASDWEAAYRQFVGSLICGE